MALHPLPKKIKLEENGDLEQSENEGGEGLLGNSIQEQEEALIALIEHRTKEFEQLNQKASYYQSQAEAAERRLQESRLQLARLRGSSGDSGPAGGRRSRAESPALVNGVGARSETIASSHLSRPPLVIPSINPKVTTTKVPPPEVAARSKPTSLYQPTPKAPEKSMRETTTVRSSEKRKLVEKEHQDLIPNVRKSSSPNIIPFQPGTYIHSQHKRKLRTLVLSPVDDQLLVTSALDGVVNLWQVQAKGPSANLLSSTDCLSPKHRRWPEDIAWHPDGNSLFSAYTGDAGDCQISVLNLRLSGNKKVTFLEEKPHVKGIINSIIFMPWSDLCFATGGSDHAVILWSEKNDSWKPRAIHRTQHTSAVMGVAGLLQKKVILSTGSDKRVIGYDLLAERAEFKHQIDSRCMSVLPNPCDFNLFMVQTGTISKQLRLFDIRLRKTEIHSFGWKQESSETQSALINQAWSPDGLYLSSGTADPMIHIFDIRYNGNSPSQSVQAHQKRVFKAIWHQSHPLLTSISSDLNIGLHKISK
ncbi:uncharacterized protein LOC110031247 [Phalaenopsis equestris]|uniref:uncharacterized protein LOC110031247 n=1 Tax=Phalaenopsis equestris TaxID=78828 RepID=UPI0009E5F4BB|nr:uncharacterized protein LOC110031247 [Phalaenopsis equestris]XP_020590023.1 uncharacterized protein LOC110031247 [Phalaenopsis equestris]XP_020590024.1 uncharacterized protein LOC110031247 [Phalaenopsis equestris]